ncbi:unnamed protein product, partial [Discosporangium mesarthrocarpum]
RRNSKHLGRYKEAVDAIRANLVLTSGPGGLTFVGELVDGGLSPKVSTTP